jgi:hypothetical protein
MNPEIHVKPLILSSRTAENEVNAGVAQGIEVDKGILHTRQGQVENLQ